MAVNRWHRDRYVDAVWESTSLKPLERLVAVVYADHAGKSDVSWVTWERLSQRTGIRAKSTISRAVRGLVEAGWLRQVEPARQHRSPRYQLLIPDVASEYRHVYDADSEVADMDPWTADEGDQTDTPEVAEMDTWKSPEVAERSPEVAERSARGSGALPDFSNYPSNRPLPRVAQVVGTCTTPGAEAGDDDSTGWVVDDRATAYAARCEANRLRVVR